jgi:hypothetical protein
MNPHATESLHQYAFRRCCEDIEQARLERRFMWLILAEAKRAQDHTAVESLRVWFPISRANINRMTANRTRLRIKLTAADMAQGIAEQGITT